MKKSLLLFSLFITSALYSMPYYAERNQGSTTFIFKGEIADQNEPEARSLEAKFFEYPERRAYYRAQLGNLGIEVYTITRNDHKRSQLPLDVTNPNLPEGVTGMIAP